MPRTAAAALSVTPRLLGEIRSQYTKDPHQQPFRNAATHAAVERIAIDGRRVDELHTTFSDELDMQAAVSDQMESGRCWLFSFLNVLRAHVINKYDLQPDFQFSQSHMYFWHMFEKSNLFLERMWQKRNEPVHTEDIRLILKDPVSDGGHWNMIQNLVRKYGVVPAHCMAESYQANHTTSLNTLLCSRLRKCAWELRTQPMADGQSIVRRTEMMGEVYRVLCAFLGEPPTRFRWDAVCETEKTAKAATVHTTGSAIQKKTFRRSEWVTPVAFYRKYVNVQVDDYVTVIHYPDPSKPFHRRYCVRMLNNMVGGRESCLYNVPISSLQTLAKRAIDAGEPVWFSSDVGKDFSEKLGVMDPVAFQYSPLLNGTVADAHGWDKGARMKYQDGTPDHAMVLRGYHAESSPNIRPFISRTEKALRRRTASKKSEKASTSASKPHSAATEHKQRGGNGTRSLSTRRRRSTCRTATSSSDEVPSRWLVENSWGDEVGHDGNFVMSKEWFERHVYEIAVHKRHLKGLWHEKPGQGVIKLEPWDVFGNLY